MILAVGRVSSTILVLSLMTTGCMSSPHPTEHAVEAHILMTLDEFIAANGDEVADALPHMDKTSPSVTFSNETPTAFKYGAPTDRFALEFVAIGSPADTTRYYFSRGTRRGLDVLALMSIQFSQSDGAPLAKRISEAGNYYQQLIGAGFKHTDYDKFEIRIDDEILTDFRMLEKHIERIDVPRVNGMHLFVVEDRNIVVDVAVSHQAYPDGGGQGVYTLNIFIREE